MQVPLGGQQWVVPGDDPQNVQVGTPASTIHVRPVCSGVVPTEVLVAEFGDHVSQGVAAVGWVATSVPTAGDAVAEPSVWCRLTRTTSGT